MKSRQNLKPSDVQRELLDEQSPGLLKELHLLTPMGGLNADARRKLKQVNHLINLINPAIADIFSRFENPLVIDVGAGKAYLGFITYQLYFDSKNKGQILSIESRAELMEKAEQMAKRLNFNRMKFICSSISEYKSLERVHLVTALHACDTATDEAIALGIRAKADHIAIVPCCQAEVADLLKKEKTSELKTLWDHGIHRREFGSHITNVLRGLVLESLGYQVTVTELVGWEHSLKNELILGKRIQNENPMAKAKLLKLLAEIKVRPKIIRDFYPEI